MVCNHGVRGSNPLRSTNIFSELQFGHSTAPVKCRRAVRQPPIGLVGLGLPNPSQITGRFALVNCAKFAGRPGRAPVCGRRILFSL